jgi:hypothetical protein
MVRKKALKNCRADVVGLIELEWYLDALLVCSRAW